MVVYLKAFDEEGAEVELELEVYADGTVKGRKGCEKLKPKGLNRHFKLTSMEAKANEFQK